MFLDIRKLFSQPESAQPLHFSLDFSDEDFPGYRMEAPCEGSLEISWEGHGHRLRLKLEAQATVLSECGRCLKPVQAGFPLSRTILLREQDWMDCEEDLPITAEGKLDVSELVYTEIVVTAPSMFLCDENCKGLCPVCGKERALGCTCEENVTDGSFSILKQLL